jgi:hypothetical protein
MFAMIESNSNKFYSQIHVVLNHSPKAQGGAMAADKPQGLSRQDIDQYISVSLSHRMSRTLLYVTESSTELSSMSVGG